MCIRDRAGLLVAVVALVLARSFRRASAADTEVGGECGLRNADCGMADGDPDRITGAGGTGCPIGDRQSEVDNADSSGPAPVSYTHLTLPTIYPV